MAFLYDRGCEKFSGSEEASPVAVGLEEKQISDVLYAPPFTDCSRAGAAMPHMTLGKDGSTHRHLAALMAFTVGFLFAFGAHALERPITAAIVALFTVTAVGALEGVRGGIFAAALASLIYNFFLSEPVFSFSLNSVDEYVPLIAFNASAAASGYLVGRLRDRAHAAEISEGRVRALFEVSQLLQSTVATADITRALSGLQDIGGGASPPELYIGRHGVFSSREGADQAPESASQAFDEDPPTQRPDGSIELLLKGASGRLGVLVLPQGSSAFPGAGELDALAGLVAIAVERCLLLEEQARADLLRRSEELKTALLSSVSHDMRTPLNTIQASASSLAHYEMELSPETRRDLLALIEEQCVRLDRYTANLLNLGRIQAGIRGFENASCDAVEVLATALHNVRSLGTGHLFRKAYSVEAAQVAGDAVMLEQSFFNVLENAARYSGEGSLITVAVEEESDFLVVLVIDEGIGIAPCDRERMFDRFTRGGASQREGSGLGLSIAKGFIEAFGGSINILPNEIGGKGTVLRMTLRVVNGGVGS
jgi:two-component system sensor histidine kinase KdpD